MSELLDPARVWFWIPITLVIICTAGAWVDRARAQAITNGMCVITIIDRFPPDTPLVEYANRPDASVDMGFRGSDESMPYRLKFEGDCEKAQVRLRPVLRDRAKKFN
jgi:hypothetical protein